MDPETTALLKQNLAVARETNELIKKMHSAQKWGRFFSFLYWAVIIVLTFGTYYYLQGPLQSLMSVYTGGVDALDKVQKSAGSLPDVNTLKSVFDKFNQ